MEFIKSIKTWFKKEEDSGMRTLVVEAQLIQEHLAYQALEEIKREIVNTICTKFLEDNADLIERDILRNEKFADAVYNAIVLTEASRVMTYRRP